jgi:hypothetical protein
MTLVFTFITATAFSADYKPITMEGLYDDCAKALVLSATPDAFLNTYCGRFLEGYGMGVLSATGLPLGAPNPADPCAADLEREFTRINGALCENLPDYRDAKTPPATILQAILTITARWHERALQSKKSSSLKKPALTEINTLITPGLFCDSLAQARPARNILAVNPMLLKANWFDFVRTKTGTLQDKYNECKADLAAGDFTRTFCGAEITGFMAGLHATGHLQKRQPAKGSCGKQINRLYDGFDIISKTCVQPDTDPARVARLFLNRVDQMRAQGDNLNQPGWASMGAAGYQALYFGALCRDTSK